MTDTYPFPPSHTVRLTAYMVTMGINRTTEPWRFTVDCVACGRMVQNTGEGGFHTPEEAQAMAQLHRAAHVENLLRESDAAVKWAAQIAERSAKFTG